MKYELKWMLAAILICGTTAVLTSCSDQIDNATPQPEGGTVDNDLAVKCINGTFIGKKTDNIISYLGIPFVGQQPVGNLRWKAPVDVTPDDGVYEAYYYGKTPMQAEGDPAALYIQGEDCLYLNVWKTDDTSTEKKPVMVWIYGGGFETGGTIDPQYDCTNFLKENPDVIVVTIAYRLAAYGFMHLSHLPDGKDYPDAQNLGTMDQLMGLKWFRRVCWWFKLCPASTDQRLPSVFQACYHTKRFARYDKI